jgi:hypothetical protein
MASNTDTSTPPATLPAFTPVPRKCNRHDGWTPKRQRDFIEGLAITGSVRSAAERIGMTPESAYLLRRAPASDEFRAAWEQALETGVARLEDLAIDRAINGVEVPVYSYGKLIGSRTVHNDRLLMFILRQRRPERYGHAAAHKSLLDIESLRAAAREAFEDHRAARIRAEAAAAIAAEATAARAARRPGNDQLAQWLIDDLDAIEAQAKAEAEARESGTTPDTKPLDIAARWTARRTEFAAELDAEFGEI